MDTVTDPVVLEQLARLERIINYQWAGIVVLFVVVAILAVLLYRSAPPGVLREIMDKFGKPVLAEVSEAAVHELETRAELTPDQLDDLAALVARKLRDGVFAATPSNPSTVNVVVQPSTTETTSEG